MLLYKKEERGYKLHGHFFFLNNDTHSKIQGEMSSELTITISLFELVVLRFNMSRYVIILKSGEFIQPIV